jgi:hypothetical protein
MLVLQNKRTSLRFRRWSRKAYATFLTIGKHVTIGKIKGIVADSLLQKQKNLKPCIALYTFSFSEKDEAAIAAIEDPPEETVSVLQQYLIALPVRKEVFGARFITVRISRIKWLKVATHAVFSHFYFFNYFTKKTNRKPKTST